MRQYTIRNTRPVACSIRDVGLTLAPDQSEPRWLEEAAAEKLRNTAGIEVNPVESKAAPKAPASKPEPLAKPESDAKTDRTTSRPRSK